MSAAIAAAPVQYRLTRRGRIVLFLTPLFIGVAVAIGFAQNVLADESTVPMQTRTVIVQPGQTLWDIAEEVDPEADTRDTIAEIVVLNDLPNSSNIQIGTRLEVPVRN